MEGEKPERVGLAKAPRSALMMQDARERAGEPATHPATNVSYSLSPRALVWSFLGSGYSARSAGIIGYIAGASASSESE